MSIPRIETVARTDFARQFGARLRAYLFAGVLLTAPIGITVYVTWYVVHWIDGNVTPLIPARYNPESYLPFELPGIGLVVALVALTALGWLTEFLIGRWLIGIAERLLGRMPLVRGLYGASKQVFTAFFGRTSPAFNQVVRIDFPRRGLATLGFVAGDAPAEVRALLGGDFVTVFVPTSPNPTGGFVLFAPNSELTPVGISADEGIRFVISGGMVEPDPRRSRIVPAAAPKPNTIARLGRRLRGYFFAGLLTAAPIAVTIYVGIAIVHWIDSAVLMLVPSAYNPEQYFGIPLPGIGVLLALVLLTLVGAITTGLLGRVMLQVTQRVLDRVPVVRAIYASIRQVMEALLKRDTTAYRQTVLCEYPREGLWTIGFLAGPTARGVQPVGTVNDDSVSVFVPTAPNPTAGYVLFLPRNNATLLDMTVEQALKLVMSSGIVQPEVPELQPERSVRAATSRSNK
jgi:uncharacterized membrane protein